MNRILNQNLFFVKEHIGMFKASNNYDIINPETEEIILNCREPELGLFTKILRFTGYKTMTPFNVEITSHSGEKVLTVKRGVSWFLSNVDVLDENDRPIGKFKQKLFSIGGRFNIYDAEENQLCTLIGKWTSWEFKFIDNEENEIAYVTKKWAGLGKELFTSADNYILEINPNVPNNSPLRQLVMAAVMCIDMVLKEK
jgi:uncharacterized protein YxjI